MAISFEVLEYYQQLTKRHLTRVTCGPCGLVLATQDTGYWSFVTKDRCDRCRDWEDDDPRFEW